MRRGAHKRMMERTHVGDAPRTEAMGMLLVGVSAQLVSCTPFVFFRAAPRAFRLQAPVAGDLEGDGILEIAFGTSEGDVWALSVLTTPSPSSPAAFSPGSVGL